MVQRRTPRETLPAQTAAWRTFMHNLDMIKHLVHLSDREAKLRDASLARFNRNLTATAKKLEDSRTATSQVKRRVMDEVIERMQKIAIRGDRVNTASRWQTVVLVTCVEAYLQDLLQAAAAVDTKLMALSEQSAKYGDVLEAASIQALARDLRDKWARRWIMNGGPAAWIQSLVKMGARGYSDTLSVRMELVWGIRHVMIHSAGATTNDFLHRHKFPKAEKAGDRIAVSPEQYVTFQEAAVEFINVTDAFALARWPDLKEPARLRSNA